MKAKTADAEKQVKHYGDVPEKKYHDLRLRRYAVVAAGFERLVWEEFFRSTEPDKVR